MIRIETTKKKRKGKKAPIIRAIFPPCLDTGFVDAQALAFIPGGY